MRLKPLIATSGAGPLTPALRRSGTGAGYRKMTTSIFLSEQIDTSGWHRA